MCVDMSSRTRHAEPLTRPLGSIADVQSLLDSRINYEIDRHIPTERIYTLERMRRLPDPSYGNNRPDATPKWLSPVRITDERRRTVHRAARAPMHLPFPTFAYFPAEHLPTVNSHSSEAAYLPSIFDCRFTIRSLIGPEHCLQKQGEKRGTDGPIALAA